MFSTGLAIQLTLSIFKWGLTSTVTRLHATGYVPYSSMEISIFVQTTGYDCFSLCLRVQINITSKVPGDNSCVKLLKGISTDEKCFQDKFYFKCLRISIKIYQLCD